METNQTTTTAAPFTVGQRVKWSEYALCHYRSYWLSAGSEPAKSNAKEEYKTRLAARGTVTECSLGAYANWTVKVLLDTQTSPHHSLPYMWTEAEGRA